MRAATAVSVVPKAVITITMVSGVAAFTWRRISIPSPSGQAHVGDHHVDRLVGEHGGGLGAAVRDHDLVALLAQHDAEHLPHRLLVVDHQDPAHERAPTGSAATTIRGSRTSTSVPRAGALRTVMSPPCSRTIR